MSVAKRKKPNPPVSEPSAKPYEPTDQDRAAAKAHLARRAARESWGVRGASEQKMHFGFGW